MTPPVPSRSWFDRALRLYPRAFLREFGPEMSAMAGTLLQERGRRAHGLLLADVLRSVPRTRWEYALQHPLEGFRAAVAFSGWVVAVTLALIQFGYGPVVLMPAGLSVFMAVLVLRPGRWLFAAAGGPTSAGPARSGHDVPAMDGEPPPSGERSGAAGVCLVVGGLAYLLFFLEGVLERDLYPPSPHWLQLITYGAMVIVLGTGLVRSGLVQPPGRNRALWLIGASIASLGLVVSVELQGLGFALVGLAAFLSRRSRPAGAALMAGTLLWLVLWLMGAHFNSEDSAPLTMPEVWISSAGLILVAVGLVLLGARLLSPRRRLGSAQMSAAR
jgi:hypothetical protein